MAEESARVAQRCEAAKASGELLLDGCGLRKFPDAVFFLMKGVELRTVSLANNTLSRIPAKMGVKFSTITALDLSHNNLSVLPDDLCALAQLASLNLSHNHFQALPDVLRQLPALTEVDLSSNQITAVQAVDFDPMQSLESVDLRGNPLSPDSKQVLQSMVRIRAKVDD